MRSVPWLGGVHTAPIRGVLEGGLTRPGAPGFLSAEYGRLILEQPIENACVVGGRPERPGLLFPKPKLTDTPATKPLLSP